MEIRTKMCQNTELGYQRKLTFLEPKLWIQTFMCNQYKVKNYTQKKKSKCFICSSPFSTFWMHRDAKHTNPMGLDVILKSATTLGKKHSKLQLSLRVAARPPLFDLLLQDWRSRRKWAFLTLEKFGKFFVFIIRTQGFLDGVANICLLSQFSLQ